MEKMWRNMYLRRDTNKIALGTGAFNSEREAVSAHEIWEARNKVIRAQGKEPVTTTLFPLERVATRLISYLGCIFTSRKDGVKEDDKRE